MTEQPAEANNGAKKLEREQTAQALQRKIEEFATKKLEEREVLLPDLFALIKSDGGRENLKTLPNIDKIEDELSEAINSTLETSWETGAENPTDPWTGGHTVVAVKDDGVIIGLSIAPTDGYEEFGDLTPAALAKAIAALHLNKAVGENHDTFTGGLSTLANIRYLKSLGFNYHDGATENPAQFEDTFVFLGSSGCTATSEYLSGLLDEGGQAGKFTLAGAMDKAFVSLTKRHLSSPDLGSNPIPEPEFAQEIRAVRN